MSRAYLPPYEPPDEPLDSISELLKLARVTEGVAQQRLHKTQTWISDPHLSREDRMLLEVQLKVNRFAAILWGRKVEELERLSRVMGLNP